MYTYVGLIITPGTSPEETLSKADSILAKYDLNIEVKEYKSYLDDAEIASMENYYESPDREHLTTKISDWTGGSPGGNDENGLYSLTTRNPKGRIDSWQLFGPGPVDPGMFTHPDAYCSAIILDDGEWQKSPAVYNMSREEAGKIMDQWEADLEETIKASQDKVSLIARCHS